MENGYQSNIRLDQLVFTGNIPAQYLLGDFGTTQGIDNYTLALQPALSQYKDGLSLRVVFANTNTGPVTLNINNLGAIPVLTYVGSGLSAELPAGALLVGKVYGLVYLNGMIQLLEDPGQGIGRT